MTLAPGSAVSACGSAAGWEFIEGPFRAVNRPLCIVEVHTSLAKASFVPGSIFKATVQIYWAELCSPF